MFRTFFTTAALLLLAGSAMAEGQRPPGSGWFDIGLILVMVFFFYFFLIRPQNKRAKEHRELVSNLGKGDEVVTAGGIIGKVSKVSDDYVNIETGNQIELSFQKVAITAVLPKGTMKELNK